jgi:site-specific DNA-adenine methylase
MLVPPLAYQGGKQRLSEKIVEFLTKAGKQKYYDLCCGCGAVSVELINQGIAPENIVMVDKGPWGLFWELVGKGEFDMKVFAKYIADVPKDLNLVRDYMKALAEQPAHVDTAYVYLILQASSFGGKAIWIDKDKWINCSFRRYWLPTATSNRRSPVNSMMPLPETLYARVFELTKSMKGIKGICSDVQEVPIEDNSVVYIDPPYAGTTHFGYQFGIMEYVNTVKTKCFVSESKALCANAHQLAGLRRKGGISGSRGNWHEEWLSEFN